MSNEAKRYDYFGNYIETLYEVEIPIECVLGGDFYEVLWDGKRRGFATIEHNATYVDRGHPGLVIGNWYFTIFFPHTGYGRATIQKPSGTLVRMWRTKDRLDAKPPSGKRLMSDIVKQYLNKVRNG